MDIFYSLSSYSVFEIWHVTQMHSTPQGSDHVLIAVCGQ